MPVLSPTLCPRGSGLEAFGRRPPLGRERHVPVLSPPGRTSPWVVKPAPTKTYLPFCRRPGPGGTRRSDRPPRSSCVREGEARSRPLASLALAFATWKMCPSGVRTNLPVVRLSLNRSQCGGCSNKLRHPDRDLGRLRMIWRLHVAWDGSVFQPWPDARSRRREKGCIAVALPPRGPRAPRVSLPPEAEALKESSHVWAGFWLRGVQP